MTTARTRTRQQAPLIGTIVPLHHDCSPALVATIRDDDGRLVARCLTCGASAPLDATREETT